MCRVTYNEDTSFSQSYIYIYQLKKILKLISFHLISKHCWNQVKHWLKRQFMIINGHIFIEINQIISIVYFFKNNEKHNKKYIFLQIFAQEILK